MTRELAIRILMQDGSTKKEAERYLDFGTDVYENLNDYIQTLTDNGIEPDEDNLNVAEVKYNGRIYWVEYVI